MTRELKGPLSQKPSCKVELDSRITPQWIEALFSLKGTVNEIHRKIVPSMYAAIPKDVISASVYDKERMIGTGLAILDRDYAGIYAIHVAENYRGLHIGRSICLALLNARPSRALSPLICRL